METPRNRPVASRSLKRAGAMLMALPLVAVLGWSGSAGASVPASASLPQVPGLELARPASHLPTRAGTVDSTNWSGYADVAAAGQKITSVDTSYTVPSAALLPPGFSATWTGIGGYNTSDLIQAGTAEDSTPTNPLLGDQYYAWYEILPASETQLTGCSGDSACTVTPGDHMSVGIAQGTGDAWTISIADAGHWTWSKTLTYASSNSSAEWIQEAPSLGGAQTTIADDGTVGFGPGNTYQVSGGTSSDIASGEPVQIDLSPAGVVNEATPSALASDGDSFNVCSYAQSCAAP